MHHLYSPRKEHPVVSHLGVFRQQIPLWQGIVLLLGGLIGAGILGIPYAVARVGLLVGIIYIIVLGLLLMGLNLMIGEIAVRTKEPLQLVGFAGKYLGKPGKYLMSVLI